MYDVPKVKEHMNGLQVRILRNLKERVYPVNEMVALSGIEDIRAGLNALTMLVDAGMVVMSQPGLFPHPMYSLSLSTRLSFDTKPTLVK